MTIRRPGGQAAVAPDLAATQSRTSEPLSGEEFSRCMARFAPFETRPHVAVAVSGGADSLALALCAADWANAAGGAVTALIVDHRLRAESAGEASQVATWLGAAGIAHAILIWQGNKPSHGIMAAAREARYRLLFDWCAANGVLHLLLAHQAEDQIETFLLRLSRDSGPDGLASMPRVSERCQARIIRPLLAVPHARLIATLKLRGQPWIEDPSNRDQRYARARLRALAPELAAHGLIGERFAALVDRFAARRRGGEWELADFLARFAAIYPEGWGSLDRAALRAASPATARAALARMAMVVGGGAYSPRSARIARLADDLRGEDAATRSLGGCLFFVRTGRILIAREPAASAAGRDVNPGATVLWDDRFMVTRRSDGVSAKRLEPLGARRFADVARELEKSGKPLLRKVVPQCCGAVMPALIDLDGGYDVPHLLYGRKGRGADSVIGCRALFRPSHALAGPGFAG